MVYCRSDSACLCLSCDQNVHSANALSRRHSRTLLCERCNSQPAFVRCIEESLSLCQNCDWKSHSDSSSASPHKRQTINCYSGCPSASELSTIWSFVLDVPCAGDSTCEQGIGSMSICNTDGLDKSVVVEINEAKKVDESGNLCEGSSSMPQHNFKQQNVGAPEESVNATSSKVTG